MTSFVLESVFLPDNVLMHFREGKVHFKKKRGTSEDFTSPLPKVQTSPQPTVSVFSWFLSLWHSCLYNHRFPPSIERSDHPKLECIALLSWGGRKCEPVLLSLWNSYVFVLWMPHQKQPASPPEAHQSEEVYWVLFVSTALSWPLRASRGSETAVSEKQGWKTLSRLLCSLLNIFPSLSLRTDLCCDLKQGAEVPKLLKI